MSSTTMNPPRLARGHVFAGRYEVKERLGEGGMATVYRAIDRALDETVALKILAPIVGVSPETTRMFRQEVKLSRRVTHANVVRVYDIGEVEGSLYMSMELVCGMTLRQAMKAAASGRLPAAEVLRIGCSLADGLAAVHAHGIVHRDLKPANVMIEQGGRVILTDFGIASPVAEDPAASQGGLFGTLRYMAPEQFRKGKVGPQTDLYAFGLLLLEVSTGDLPFRDRSALLPALDVDAVQIASAAGDAERHVIDGLEALIRWCLQQDPEARPSSANAVRGVLVALSEAVTGTVSVPVPWSAGVSASDSADTDSERTRVLSRTLEEPTAPTDASSLVRDLGTKGIAVLPFRYLGPPELTYLGVTLAGELVDLLSQSRGIRVLGTGATSAFSASRDPRAIGAALGALVVVDGVIQMIGERSRMSVRLLDAKSGHQIGSEQHEGTLAELLAFQPALIRRIAASVRVELTTHVYGAGLPAQVVDDYLTARRDAMVNDAERVLAAFERFDRCATAAPHFLPAISGRAISAVRAWFLERYGTAGRDWESVSLETVDRAMSLAPELSETHLAAGMFATQRIEMHRAVRSLQRALQIAPTSADVHEYLGMLRCETGKQAEGLQNLVFATDFDPSRPLASMLMARDHALRGDHEKAEALLEEGEQKIGGPIFASMLLRLRMAGWRRGVHAVPLTPPQRAALAQPHAQLIALYADVLTGNVDAPAFSQRSSEFLSNRFSARAFTASGQIIVELSLLMQRTDDALELLARVVDVGLVDIVWLEHCTLLAPLWQRPRMLEIHRKVSLYVQAMWM